MPSLILTVCLVALICCKVMFMVTYLSSVSAETPGMSLAICSLQKGGSARPRVERALLRQRTVDSAVVNGWDGIFTS